ncbi:MAG: hypothetical protein WD800_03470 [Dehalococcoidia bacterium]
MDYQWHGRAALLAVLLGVALCTAGCGDDAPPAIFADNAEFTVTSNQLRERPVEDYAAIEEAIEWEIPLPDALPEGVALITAVNGVQGPEQDVRRGGSQVTMFVPDVGLINIWPRSANYSGESNPIDIGGVEGIEITDSARYLLTWEDCGLDYTIEADHAFRAEAMHVAEAFVEACSG